MGVLSHEGRRVISFLRPAGPTSAVFKAYASSGSSGAEAPLALPSPPETNSANDGPAFNLSRNVVVRRRGVSGELVVVLLVAEGSEDVVAYVLRRHPVGRIARECVIRRVDVHMYLRLFVGVAMVLGWRCDETKC